MAVPQNRLSLNNLKGTTTTPTNTNMNTDTDTNLDDDGNLDADASPEGSDGEPAEFPERSKATMLWMTPTAREKLRILKKDMGVTWSLFFEIACEQLLASGVVSPEGRTKFREQGYSNVDMASGDRYWRGAFGIGEPWPEAAASQAKILDELTLTNSLLGELVQAVEDHGTMVAECEHVITLDDPDT